MCECLIDYRQIIERCVDAVCFGVLSNSLNVGHADSPMSLLEK